VPIRPVAVGLVLCELAIVDEKTHNVTAASCFSRRVVDGNLAAMPPFYVVATMVNGHGEMPGKLVIERLDTLAITYERAITLRFSNSLVEVTALFRVRAHAIPVHGYYQALLIIDGEAIAQKRFSILPKETKS
jgi:hypothetical protein